jgi:hypothetical protein
MRTAHYWNTLYQIRLMRTAHYWNNLYQKRLMRTAHYWNNQSLGAEKQRAQTR